MNATSGAMSDAASGPHPSTALIYIFNAIFILGFLSLSAIVTVAWLSPSIQRSKTWYSFMMSWIMYDVVNLLLLGQQTGGEPSHGLCLAQASLRYTVPVLTSFANFAMVLQLFLSVWFCLPVGNNSSARNSIGIYLLLIIPPGLSLFVFLEALVDGIQHPEKVVRSNSGQVCEISDGISMKISAACVIVAMVSSMLVEICIAVTVCRHWTAFRNLAKHDRQSRNWENCESTIRFTFFFLLALFSCAIGLVLTFSQTNDCDSLLNARYNIVVGILPVAVAVTFGTQKDILQTFVFCRRRERFQVDSERVQKDMSPTKVAPA
ncbi:hypothetical protein D9758_001748 [Tetrapyrgos nigripes]|uniref:Uncharacterized protein n=1 Tax=Tetrapyrgos nigripes TaxID=182062 RepID=A0A8H5LXK7_9AGAR|nr:hypothetical protein D9758_001748 [Tetrapyrgos nigripes]